MKRLLMITAVLFSFYTQTFAQSSEPTVNTVQPKIMVIPFTKENEDIRTVLEADVNRRVAITKVKEAFDNRDFTTVDFTAKLKQAMDDHLFTSDNQSDMKSTLVEMSGADIYVEVEVPDVQMVANSANGARIILTAYDASTANSLSNKVCESPKFYTQDYGALVMRALGKSATLDSKQPACIEEFLNTLQSKFTDIVNNGRPVKINFSLAQGSKLDFSTEIKPEGIPFSDVIEAWISDNSVKNNYHIQANTKLKILFDDVRIPLKDEKGKNYLPNKYALKIYQWLKTKNVNCAKDIKNRAIYITIN